MATHYAPCLRPATNISTNTVQARSRTLRDILYDDMTEGKPFRFLALLKEMQSEVLEHLDLATRKAVSLCSRETRESTASPTHHVNHSSLIVLHAQLPVLFRKVGLPGIEGDIAAFPVEAGQHVQSFHFLIILIPAASKHALRVRSKIDAQFGALSNLTRLRDLRLIARFEVCLIDERPERTVSVLRANIFAIAAQRPGVKLSVVLDDDRYDWEESPNTMFQILSAVLQPLAGQNVIKVAVDISHTASLVTTPELEAAQRAFERIAPSLQELKLLGPEWLLIRPTQAIVPNLRTLVIHEYAANSPHPLLDSVLPIFVNACAAHLTRLEVQLPRSFGTMPSGATSPSNSLICPKLKELRLSYSALNRVLRMVHKLPCTALTIFVGTRNGMRRLYELVSATLAAFTSLQAMRLHWQAVGDSWQQ